MRETERTVRTFSTYQEARGALERLLDHDLPPSAMSISARGIRLVEHVRPRGWMYATGDGALNGALVGLVVGFFMGLFNLNAPGLSAVVLGFWGAAMGCLAGIATSLVVHGLRRDSERHATERSMRAEHFDLCVRADQADRARRILSEAPGERLGSAA